MSNESEHLYSYITIVLDELYTEFFKQVFKVELLSTEQGHEDKDFGLCFCKCSLFKRISPKCITPLNLTDVK